MLSAPHEIPTYFGITCSCLCNSNWQLPCRFIFFFPKTGLYILLCCLFNLFLRLFFFFPDSMMKAFHDCFYRNWILALASWLFIYLVLLAFCVSPGIRWWAVQEKIADFFVRFVKCFIKRVLIRILMDECLCDILSKGLGWRKETNATRNLPFQFTEQEGKMMN